MPKNVMDGIDEILKNQEEERRREEEILDRLKQKQSSPKQPVPTDEDVLLAEARAADYRKRFFLLADQRYLWVYPKADYIRQKWILLALLLLSFPVGIAATVAITRAKGYYITFSLFENLWLLVCAFRLLHVLLARRWHKASILSSHSPWHFDLDDAGIWIKGGRKKRHKILLILCLISVFFTIVTAIDQPDGVAVAPIVLDGIFAALTIASEILYRYFFSFYTAIRFEGDSMDGQSTVTLILDLVTGKMCKEEDYICRSLIEK